MRRSGNDDELPRRRGPQRARRSARRSPVRRRPARRVPDPRPERGQGRARGVPRLRANHARGRGGRDRPGRGVLGADRRLAADGVETDAGRGRAQGAAAPLRVQAVSEVPSPPESPPTSSGRRTDLPAPGGGIPAVLYADANDDHSSNIYTSLQIEPPRLHTSSSGATIRRCGSIGGTRTTRNGCWVSIAGRSRPATRSARSIGCSPPTGARSDPRRGVVRGPNEDPLFWRGVRDRRHPDQARRGPPAGARRPAADDGGPPAATPAARGRAGSEERRRSRPTSTTTRSR